ncbi:hypothetical protein ABZ543_12675 [Streptomyces roseifaciens]
MADRVTNSISGGAIIGNLVQSGGDITITGGDFAFETPLHVVPDEEPTEQDSRERGELSGAQFRELAGIMTHLARIDPDFSAVAEHWAEMLMWHAGGRP